jgi:hypothetical protein
MLTPKPKIRVLRDLESTQKGTAENDAGGQSLKPWTTSTRSQRRKPRRVYCAPYLRGCHEWLACRLSLLTTDSRSLQLRQTPSTTTLSTAHLWLS